VRHHIRASIHSSVLIRFPIVIVALVFATYANADSPTVVQDSTTAPVIVIGFVGGFVRHGDMVHSGVQVGAHLRQEYPSGVYVEVLENRRREEAHAKILRILDTDHDGKLSVEEKRNARIILYGHSWGAAAVVALARELDKEGIPVLLTVQVDSVSKPGGNDRVIPANVAEAANFFQTNGFLHGQPEIRAADPSRTHIIRNSRIDYEANPIDCGQYPWYDRLFMKYHTEIECDPKVWAQVESLITSRLPPQRP
jgi:hypothetical protein